MQGRMGKLHELRWICRNVHDVLRQKKFRHHALFGYIFAAMQHCRVFAHDSSADNFRIQHRSNRYVSCWLFFAVSICKWAGWKIGSGD
jgi:hypothetical protein